MKFIVNSQALLRNLQTISGVVGTNHTVPILNNFLFELEADKLTVTASDLETTMMISMPLSEVNGEGTVAVPSRILLETLKTFSDIPLIFNINDENKAIEITAGEGKYKLAGENAEGFPALPEMENTTKTEISSYVLVNAINKTIFATGNDDLRPVMSGVFFGLSPEGITFVATDAHKLVRYKRLDAKSENEVSFIVPKKPLNQLKNILGARKEEVQVSMDYNDKNAFFAFDNLSIICRLIDGKFPNYEAVIPKENPNKMTVDRMGFLNAIKRVSIFSSQSTPQARLKIEDKKLTITAEDLDYANEAKERFTCNYEGEPMEIGFNSKFLLEMLNNVDTDEICIEMSHPTRAGILLPIGNQNADEDILMLVMPIMLNQ